jgi:DNA-directed RNA polymerase subunit alpha
METTTFSGATQNPIIARNWRDLIRPRTLEKDSDSLTLIYGKFTCEPLERGFGITIGNSLRRVLLSSLQGAAITAVRIDGALHEFTTLPGVVEDVTDIILNLKEVLIKMEGEGPQTIRIDKKGKGPLTAGDILTPEGITILNADHHVATLVGDAKLSMERCRWGEATFPPSGIRTKPPPLTRCPSMRCFLRCARSTTP